MAADDAPEFGRDMDYERFLYSPVTLSCHEMAARRLSSLLADLNQFSRQSGSGYDVLNRRRRDVVAHFETLRAIFVSTIRPLYRDSCLDIRKKLSEVREKIMKNDMAVIEDLEWLEDKILIMLQDKSLLFETREKTELIL